MTDPTSTKHVEIKQEGHDGPVSLGILFKT